MILTGRPGTCRRDLAFDHRRPRLFFSALIVQFFHTTFEFPMRQTFHFNNDRTTVSSYFGAALPTSVPNPLCSVDERIHGDGMHMLLVFTPIQKYFFDEYHLIFKHQVESRHRQTWWQGQ